MPCLQGFWPWQQVIQVCHDNLSHFGTGCFFIQSPSFSRLHVFLNLSLQLLYCVMMLISALCAVCYVMKSNNVIKFVVSSRKQIVEVSTFIFLLRFDFGKSL